MSEEEIHTLETINTKGSSLDNAHSDNDVNEANSSSSCIDVSDNEEAPDLDQPNVIMPSTAFTSVSHEEAHPDTSLETACQEGDLHSIDQLLTPETLNSGGLHHAAAHNNWRACKLLLSRGADVNFRLSPLNATPILWAARNGHAYIVKLLLDNGADPNVADSSGFTLLHLAVHSSNVLMVAYVVHLEVNVDKPDVGNRTPLHWAIVQGDHLSVEVLLKAGASSNFKDGEGALPLQLAAYNSKSQIIVSLLLQHGADPMGVAIDLTDPPAAWVEGCRISGRLPNGILPKSRILSPELAKIITSVTPLVVVPVALNLPVFLGSAFLGVPLAIILAWQTKRSLEKYVIPYCWPGEKAILQSTMIAGIFVSIFLCICYFWFTRLATVMFYQRPWSSLFLAFLMFIISVSYITTMVLDPGKVEPKSMVIRLKSMNDLMDRGLFDSVHLCIHTFVAIPLRAQYDYYLERVICRYDHYCPWLYNAIGVRNHRAFLIFVIALSVGIPVVGMHYFSYSRQFGSSTFANGLCVLTLFQSIWVYVLGVVQLSQIARGATSYEVAHMDQLLLYKTDPIRAYSSLPRDHPKTLDVLGDISSASSLLKHNRPSNGCSHGHNRKHKAPLWMRITGLSQVRGALHILRHRFNVNKTDFGVSQNCIDFWYSGGNVFRPSGMTSSLGGVSVDYSSLVDLPSHPSTEVDQILA